MQLTEFSYKSFIRTVFIFCFMGVAHNTHAQKQPTIQHITFRGNVFEVLESADTAEMLDPVTNEVELVYINPNPLPLKYNNMHIYSKDDVERQSSANGDILTRYLLQALSKHLSAFADGDYRVLLTNVIINHKGKVVYYNFGGFEKKAIKETYTAGTDPEPGKPKGKVFERIKWNKVYEEQQELIGKTVDNAVEKAPTYQPATVKGYPVPIRLPDDATQRAFSIKKGAIIYK